MYVFYNHCTMGDITETELVDITNGSRSTSSSEFSSGLFFPSFLIFILVFKYFFTSCCSR